MATNVSRKSLKEVITLACSVIFIFILTYVVIAFFVWLDENVLALLYSKFSTDLDEAPVRQLR